MYGQVKLPRIPEAPEGSGPAQWFRQGALTRDSWLSRCRGTRLVGGLVTHGLYMGEQWVYFTKMKCLRTANIQLDNEVLLEYCSKSSYTNTR